MGSGNHLDFGLSPSPVCAYLRDLAGWCDDEVDLTADGVYDAEHGDYNTVMKYRTSKPNEYFVVENRSKMGLDRGSPASGLAVYHCDILGSNELQHMTLLSPTGRRAVLHSQLGDAESHELVATFDSASPGILTNMIGQPVKGAWVLTVADRAQRDVGQLNRWRLELTTAPAG